MHLSQIKTWTALDGYRIETKLYLQQQDNNGSYSRLPVASSKSCMLLWIVNVQLQMADGMCSASHCRLGCMLVKFSVVRLVSSSLRRLYRPSSAAGDEEPVADQVPGEEQTTEEALPQTQAVLVQREAQVHQLAHGSQWVQMLLIPSRDTHVYTEMLQEPL